MKRRFRVTEVITVTVERDFWAETSEMAIDLAIKTPFETKDIKNEDNESIEVDEIKKGDDQ